MSRRQDAFSWIAIAFTLIIVIAIGFYVIGPEMGNRTVIRLGDAVLASKAIKNHSGKGRTPVASNQLSAGEAELIVFSDTGRWPVKTDDIKTASDLIWLDENRKVVYIVKNIEPSSLKADSLRPSKDSRYIVEVRAGTVDNKMISVGSEAVFDDGIYQEIGQ